MRCKPLLQAKRGLSRLWPEAPGEAIRFAGDDAEVATEVLRGWSD